MRGDPGRGFRGRRKGFVLPAPERPLFIDRTTFSDLELHQQGRDSLPGRVDRTRTVAGSRRLRERLGQPMSDPELLQMALSGPAFLASIPPPPPLDGEAIHALTQYLDSRIMTLGDRSLSPGLTEAAWVSLRDPELLTLARVGIPAARRVVENLEALVPPLLAMAPPRVWPWCWKALPDSWRSSAFRNSGDRAVSPGGFWPPTRPSGAATGGTWCDC